MNILESLHVSLMLGEGGTWRAKLVGVKTQNLILLQTRKAASILPV